MDLRTLWRFASHWYDGRLDRGYVRREPEAATEYLRSVGLSGPFWACDPPCKPTVTRRVPPAHAAIRAWMSQLRWRTTWHASVDGHR
jgi:hypothetical protein